MTLYLNKSQRLTRIKLGNYSNKIPLTQGIAAIVDAGDFKWLIQWKWHAHWDKHTGTFYAARRTSANGIRGRVFMHRAILGLLYGDKRQGDHKSGNTLDNRRHNLRIATPAQNTQNSRLRPDNITGFKGVHKQGKKWWATITCNHKRHYLGTFATIQEAVDAYQKAAILLHGEFARLE